MRFHEVMTLRRGQKLIGGALLLLGLAGVGLPSSWAQTRNNGSSLQAPRARSSETRPPAEPSGISGEGAQAAYYNNSPSHPRATQPRTISSAPKLPPSLSPDHDDFYFLGSLAAIPAAIPMAVPARISATRSYYYVGGQPGHLVSSPPALVPDGIPAAALPWNREGFKDYDELAEQPQESPRPLPRKYTLKSLPLAQGPPAARLAAAVLIVHLPEHALFWVEGKPIRLKSPTSFFPSPPLPPDSSYSYQVRADWIEDGRWVSQTRNVPVQAGLVQAIYLRSR